MMTVSHPPLDLSVVVPTYNEVENIKVIVPRICQTLEKAGIRGEVIVVDDDSPDNTGSVAEALADKYPVRVLIRKGDRGLATAVLAGFNMSTARVCAVMDSDGSHPVEKLPELVRPVLEDRAELVEDGGRRRPSRAGHGASANSRYGLTPSHMMNAYPLIRRIG